ncbi:hypothetical protein GJ496_011351 [Pomphorhynchus laevis]|nr:hypothetical protein GJ496_011351 [Pomphorhynchus laevis]
MGMYLPAELIFESMPSHFNTISKQTTFWNLGKDIFSVCPTHISGIMEYPHKRFINDALRLYNTRVYAIIHFRTVSEQTIPNGNITLTDLSK